MTETNVRIGNRGDYRSLARLRGEWLDQYFRQWPAQDRWCPACCPIPVVESESDLYQSLAQRGGQFAAVLGDTHWPMGYVLWKLDDLQKTLAVLTQTPRLRPGCDQPDGLTQLLQFALAWAREHGLGLRPTHLHGFPEHIDPLLTTYRSLGFAGELRWEMVRRGRTNRHEPGALVYRSALEVGEEQYFQTEASLSGRPVEEVRQDCEFSRRMWLVDPARDWIIGYHQERSVGVVRTALEHGGNAVLDELRVGVEYRGRGFGTDLLRRALGAFADQTELWRLDVDQSNAQAIGLYEKAGFRPLHHHVLLAAPEITSPESL